VRFFFFLFFLYVLFPPMGSQLPPLMVSLVFHFAILNHPFIQPLSFFPPSDWTWSLTEFSFNWRSLGYAIGTNLTTLPRTSGSGGSFQLGVGSLSVFSKAEPLLPPPFFGCRRLSIFPISGLHSRHFLFKLHPVPLVCPCIHWSLFSHLRSFIIHVFPFLIGFCLALTF